MAIIVLESIGMVVAFCVGLIVVGSIVGLLLAQGGGTLCLLRGG